MQYQSSGSGADRDDVDSPAGASNCPHNFRSACLDKRIRLRHHRSGAARVHAGRQARRYGKCVGRRQDPGGAGVTHGGAGGGVNRGSGSTKSSAGGRPRHRRTGRVRHGRHQTAHSQQRRVGPGQERQQLRQLRWLAPLSLATPPSPPPLLPRPPPPPPPPTPTPTRRTASPRRLLRARSAMHSSPQLLLFTYTKWQPQFHLLPHAQTTNGAIAGGWWMVDGGWMVRPLGFRALSRAKNSATPFR